MRRLTVFFFVFVVYDGVSFIHSFMFLFADPRASQMPSSVRSYHSFMPLDDLPPHCEWENEKESDLCKFSFIALSLVT